MIRAETNILTSVCTGTETYRPAGRPKRNASAATSANDVNMATPPSLGTESVWTCRSSSGLETHPWRLE
jgi:hypothetical protein